MMLGGAWATQDKWAKPNHPMKGWLSLLVHGELSEWWSMQQAQCGHLQQDCGGVCRYLFVLRSVTC